MASHTGTIICILISVNVFMDVTDLPQSYLKKKKIITDCEATKCWAVVPVDSWDPKIIFDVLLFGTLTFGFFTFYCFFKKSKNVFCQ